MYVCNANHLNFLSSLGLKFWDRKFCGLLGCKIIGVCKKTHWDQGWKKLKFFKKKIRFFDFLGFFRFFSSDNMTVPANIWYRLNQGCGTTRFSQWLRLWLRPFKWLRLQLLKKISTGFYTRSVIPPAVNSFCMKGKVEKCRTCSLNAKFQS